MRGATPILEGTGAALHDAWLRTAAGCWPEWLDGEMAMDLLYSHPATLAGILGCVALGAWAIGRWQSGAAGEAAKCAAPAIAQHPPFEWAPFEWDAPYPPSAATATPPHLPAQAEREVWFDVALSLGDLHEEVSAYRQREQVLARFGNDNAALDVIAPASHQTCRTCGLTGELARRTPQAALAVCGCERGCALRQEARAAYSSAVQPLSLTLV